MVKELAKHVIFDWGFSRLKAWAISENKKLLDSAVYETNMILKNQEFYDSFDMNTIFNYFINFLKKQNFEDELNLLLSSQMHGIAGVDENDELFFSTWSDLPNPQFKNKDEEIINGMPNLQSMPVNKVHKINNEIFIDSLNIRKFKKNMIKPKRIGSPWQILLENGFSISLNPSYSWWQSTCLSISFLNSFYQKQKFKNLGNIYNQNADIFKCSKVFRKTKFINIFPEVGDLIASTYTNISDSDIILNFGTGSQVIFKNKKISENDYYRIYPNYGKISVISHIPCGRLITEYCKVKNIGYKELFYQLKNLSQKDFENIVNKISKNLLFFPGFDHQSMKYTNNPNLEENLFNLDQKVFLVNWINQYLKVINYFIENNSVKETLKISYSGELGGMSNFLMQFVSNNINSKNIFKKFNVSIYHSLCSIYGF